MSRGWLWRLLSVSYIYCNELSQVFIIIFLVVVSVGGGRSFTFLKHEVSTETVQYENTSKATVQPFDIKWTKSQYLIHPYNWLCVCVCIFFLSMCVKRFTTPEESTSYRKCTIKETEFYIILNLIIHHNLFISCLIYVISIESEISMPGSIPH